MHITLIGAMSQETRAIGYSNSLLWYIPEDLQHFKALTVGQTILMGRKTFESIGRALPDRRNLVLSTTEVNGIEVLKSFPEVFLLAADHLFVVGGESLYRQFLPLADRVELSIVNGNHQGDRHFPEFEAGFRPTRCDITAWGSFTTWERK